MKWLETVDEGKRPKLNMGEYKSFRNLCFEFHEGYPEATNVINEDLI